jgi:hypothetical protein
MYKHPDEISGNVLGSSEGRALETINSTQNIFFNTEILNFIWMFVHHKYPLHFFLN